MHDVIEDAVKKIDLTVKARHGKIINDLSAEFSFVEADKVHLTNVILNLLIMQSNIHPTALKLKSLQRM
jgi:phosphoglycerate-specific signal transduction histidine kinase